MADVERAKRIYELMVLIAWADGKVAAAEALAVHEIVAHLPEFKDIGSKSELSKGVKARIDEKGMETALREAAAAIVDRGDRELAFRCCAKVVDADGDLGAEDADALATLQELFALSGEDVKRLMANLHG
jgi:tellurite resistance protein